jgi:hypothetical protein
MKIMQLDAARRWWPSARNRAARLRGAPWRRFGATAAGSCYDDGPGFINFLMGHLAFFNGEKYHAAMLLKLARSSASSQSNVVVLSGFSPSF